MRSSKQNTGSKSRRDKQPNLDPDLLLLLGNVAEFLGLAEHAQRILQTDKRRAKTRHARVDREWDKFKRALNDGRAALLAIQATFARHFNDAPTDAIAAMIPSSDFEIFQSAMGQLRRAIWTMTDATYALESITSSIAPETERFFKISNIGKPVLDVLREVFSGKPNRLEKLLSVADQYFIKCSQMVDERERWLHDI
jgi:hypothetical protein